MLTLERKFGEQLRITLPDGAVVLVEVKAIKGQRVWLGVEAPPEVKVVRAELPPHERKDGST